VNAVWIVAWDLSLPVDRCDFARGVFGSTGILRCDNYWL